MAAHEMPVAGCYELVVRIRTTRPEANWLTWVGRRIRGIQRATGTDTWFEDDCFGRVVIRIRGSSKQQLLHARQRVVTVAKTGLDADGQDTQQLGPRLAVEQWFVFVVVHLCTRAWRNMAELHVCTCKSME